MELSGKKLGILISARPEEPNFRHGVCLAAAALEKGVAVYLYCIDDAVSGVGDTQLQSLQTSGLHLYACAYGAHRRNIQPGELATFGGLGVVSDLIASTDRFVCFN